MNEAAKDKDADKYTVERLRELHRFFETTTAWYAQVAKLPASALVRFLNAGDKVLKSLGLGS